MKKHSFSLQGVFSIMILGCLVGQICGVGGAFAAGEAADFYRIADISVDTTAPTAAQARDKAIAEAQKTAFTQLLARMEVAEKAAELDETGLAKLVQGFEIQNGKPLAGRYIGTFAVQFKPQAVRAYLGEKGAHFSEERSAPFVIVPILKTPQRTILWEDQTSWRGAWEETAKNGGVVPVLVPAGDLDDIKLLSAVEAIEGKPEALRGLAQKYGAGGVVVAVLTGDPEDSAKREALTASLQIFDAQGAAQVGSSASLAAPTGPAVKGRDAFLAGMVKAARQKLEDHWRHAGKNMGAAQAGVAGGAGDALSSSVSSVAHLNATVAAPSLAVWEMLRGKIQSVSSVAQVQILSMTRGAIHVDLSFTGEIPALQKAFEEKGLQLTQAETQGWTISGE